MGQGHSETLSELNDTAVADTLAAASSADHGNIFIKGEHCFSAYRLLVMIFFFFNRGKIKLLWVKYSLGHGYTIA